MIHNEDRTIVLPVPFLREGSILYVGSSAGTSRLYIEEHWGELAGRFGEVGYPFVFIPDIVESLGPELYGYLFPGGDGHLTPESMYRRLQDLAGLNDQAGFLYRQSGTLYFHVLPESPDEAIESAIAGFISFLLYSQESERKEISYRKAAKMRRPPVFYDTIFGEGFEITEESSCCESAPIKESDDSIRFSVEGNKQDEEERPDPRVQAILDAWEKIEREFTKEIRLLSERPEYVHGGVGVQPGEAPRALNAHF